MGRDKRGVSAKFLQRELGVAYQTAWTMAHKLRHGLSEDPARPLRGFLEADETPARGRLAYSHNGGRFMVTKPIDGKPATHLNGRTISFFMRDAKLAETLAHAVRANV